jgi:hypothetical protein
MTVGSKVGAPVGEGVECLAEPFSLSFPERFIDPIPETPPAPFPEPFMDPFPDDMLLTEALPQLLTERFVELFDEPFPVDLLLLFFGDLHIPLLASLVLMFPRLLDFPFPPPLPCRKKSAEAESGRLFTFSASDATSAVNPVLNTAAVKR